MTAASTTPNRVVRTKKGCCCQQLSCLSFISCIDVASLLLLCCFYFRPPAGPNCEQLILPEAKGGCGLVPYDVFETFNTQFILEFIRQQQLIDSLQQAYNSLALAVSNVEVQVALANLTAGPTDTTQTNASNPLCGPPRFIRRNAFVTGYRVQDTRVKFTACNNASLTAFEQALALWVNSKDPCPDTGPLTNQTRVNVIASCTSTGAVASYVAEVEIYSHYPCRWVVEPPPPPQKKVQESGRGTCTRRSSKQVSCQLAQLSDPMCRLLHRGFL
jgi:hypothetical protein